MKSLLFFTAEDSISLRQRKVGIKLVAILLHIAPLFKIVHLSTVRIHDQSHLIPAINTHGKPGSTVTEIYWSVYIPDTIFLPQYKRKKAVWLATL